MLEPPFPVDLRLTLAPYRCGPHDPTCRVAGPVGDPCDAHERGRGNRALRAGRRSHRRDRVGPGPAAALHDAPAMLGFDDDDDGLRRPPRGRPASASPLPRRAHRLRRCAGRDARRHRARAEGDERRGPPQLGRARAPLRRDGAGARRPSPPTRIPTCSPVSATRRGIHSGSSAVGPTRSAGSAPAPRGCARSNRRRRPRPVGCSSTSPASARGRRPPSRGGALGDRDAVVTGDYHFPHIVSYTLTGSRRGTRRRDARAARALPGPARASVAPAAARWFAPAASSAPRPGYAGSILERDCVRRDVHLRLERLGLDLPRLTGDGGPQLVATRSARPVERLVDGTAATRARLGHAGHSRPRTVEPRVHVADGNHTSCACS